MSSVIKNTGTIVITIAIALHVSSGLLRYKSADYVKSLRVSKLPNCRVDCWLL